MKKTLFTTIALAMIGFATNAATVKVTMNRTSPTMTLADKASGQTINVGERDGMTYTFSAPAATYVLTALGTDGETVNGTIELDVTESDEEQAFSVLTCTTYASNSGWTIDEDYTVSVVINTREGETVAQTLGQSVTAGRRTFLAFVGNSYYATLTPNAAHQEEGYMALQRQGTLTANVNVQGAIPMGYEYSITLPADAGLFVGTKAAHYLPFSKMEPLAEKTEGTQKTVTYKLAASQVYNYRTWREGELTQAGYFTMNADETKRPQLAFTDDDYKAFDPQTIKHDVTWNGGYETGDIFLNINERGHLRLSHGETHDLLALRSWQLTDNSTNNYFMEPDFHYTVIGLDGQPSTGVVTVEKGETGADPWANLKAVGEGTAIVLVTYDAIGLNYYASGKQEKTNYMGGEYWSAIWPENTAAFVVTVGGSESTADPNMTINEAYNEDTKKLAGKYVDAEHDVFYYLDTEEGYSYTFTPTGVSSVEIAYPTIGERMATYNGFSAEGVTKNDDGSYTLLLKEGRQIVRLTDAAGNSVYQVLTAKQCHREIVNASREGSQIFQPGDKVKIQYSGLRHPANKMAGIYNMSAYVTYNGTPNGTSLILSPNQYTFGSAASAQAVTIDIPSDYDTEAAPELVMSEGVIQVNGYGDPIGNHRNTTRSGGRSANFTAVAHKTYFGAIPEVHLNISPVTNFIVRPVANVEDCRLSFSPDVTDNGDGTYTATYGTYTVTAAKKGYRCCRTQFTIGDDAEGEQTVAINMEVASTPEAWDGTETSQPATDGDTLLISTAAELAWLATEVNDSAKYTTSAVLTADIDLADYDWTPIGGQNKTVAYRGRFDGQGHTISGLYIDRPNDTHQALFGYCQQAAISRLTVGGQVRGKQYVAGIVAFQDETSVDRCTNHAEVVATAGVAGGVSAYHWDGISYTTNSINTGNVTAISKAGGIVGSNFLTSIVANCLSVGKITASSDRGACVGGGYSKNNVSNNYSTYEYAITDGQTLVSQEQLLSGEVAWLLGDAFGQNLGTEPNAGEADTIPVVDGMKVYKVLYTTNLSTEADSLFTNGTLPTLDATGTWVITWHTAPDGDIVTTVTADSTLYAEMKDASGIEEIAVCQSNAVSNHPVYDLSGRIISGQPKCGIYIRNGKKILVK